MLGEFRPHLALHVVDAVREAFAGRYRIIDIDGARIYFDKSDWALIRASNTEPVLVGRFEARSPQRLAEIRDAMEGWLREQGIGG